MNLFLAATLLFVLAALPAAAHPATPTRRRARRLSCGSTSRTHAEVGIGDEVKELAPIKALKGSGKFDVLEVWGYIYKAEYRMRFIYAQIPTSAS